MLKLRELSELILKTGNAHSFIKENEDFIAKVRPSDFIVLFDEIVREGYPMDEIKSYVNKILNIFHISLKEYKSARPQRGSFLAILERNNHEMSLLLDAIRPLFKSFIKDTSNIDTRNSLKELFSQLLKFEKHYIIKENILFPFFEKSEPDYRCIQIMWSFHDDILKDLKTILSMLESEISDLPLFNRCVGDVFFNMLAIKFREEHILFPHILSTVDEERLSFMLSEASELGFPYFQASQIDTKINRPILKENEIDLGTGSLFPEQIKLIINHLPLDITFVDEHNVVRYFSSPSKRIFPRTVSVIGREVSNCHPPESVHIVENIIASFRSGKKSHAEFWIKMKNDFILIQYFAIRDDQGLYKGIMEVSQEVSGIKALEGEKRLLDW